MKRITAILLCVVLTIVLAGCGNVKPEPVGPTEPENKEPFAVIQCDATEFIYGTVAEFRVKIENAEPSDVSFLVLASDGNTQSGMALYYEILEKDTQIFKVPMELAGEFRAVVYCRVNGKDEELASFEYSVMEDPEHVPAQNQSWEAYGIKLSTFSIECGNEIREYNVVSGTVGRLEDWVSSSLNTDGWYYFADAVISADGSYAVTELDDLIPGVTYCAEPYTGPVMTESERNEYVLGVVYRLNPCTPFYMDGLVINGTSSPFDNVDVPALRGVRSAFDDVDNMEFYVYGLRPAHEGHVTVYCFKHRDMHSYGERITEETAQNALFVLELMPGDAGEPNGIATMPTLEEGGAAGLYDLVFTYDGFVTDCMMFNYTLE